MNIRLLIFLKKLDHVKVLGAYQGSKIVKKGFSVASWKLTVTHPNPTRLACVEPSVEPALRLGVYRKQFYQQINELY